MATICLSRYLVSSLRTRITGSATIKRSFSSNIQSKSTENVDVENNKPEKSSSEAGWLSRLLVRRIETGHESQSSMLSNKDTVYELVFHAVKPDRMDEYLKDMPVFSDMVSSSKTGAKLSGSWTVEVGDLDEAVHLWKYEEGYPQLSQFKKISRTQKDFVRFEEKQSSMLRSRRNQIILAFSFWPECVPESSGNIYELRSYVLKPGTMIEWGNSWARGIKFRNEQNEAVAGFFSQVGEQNNVHHLWVYGSLQSRKEVRENAWRRPGWDACVAHTVPLIRHMTSRILIPTSYSPMK